MAMLRVSWIFTYKREDNTKFGGWSESWYKSGALVLTPALRQLILDVAVQRARNLGQLAQIIGFRITEVDDGQFSTGQALRSLTGALSVVGAGGHAPAAAGPGDIPQVAAQCRVQGAGVKNVKNFDLRGLADGDVVGGNIVFAFLQGGFAAWMNSLVNSGFGFRAIDFSQPLVKIQSISNVGLITLVGNVGYADGQAITLNRVRDTNGKSVTGTFLIQNSPAANQIQVLGWKGQTVGQSGSLRRRAYIYPQLGGNTWELVGATTRKVGRPSALYRGRASRRR